MNQRNVRRVSRPNLTPSYDLPKAKPQVRRTKLPNRLRVVIGALLAMALITIGLLVGKINSINVVGATEPEMVRAQVASFLKQPWKQGYIYWFSGPELESQLLNANIDTIANVGVHTNWLGRSLTVQIDQRHPVISWRSNNQTYLVDQKGVVASIGNGGSSQLPQIVDQTNLDVSLGKPVAPDTFVSFVLAAYAKLPKTLKLDYKSGRILQTTNELFVDTSGGYYIRFDTTRLVDDQLAEVKTILRHNIHPTSYIDVRLAYKVYYQ